LGSRNWKCKDGHQEILLILQSLRDEHRTEARVMQTGLF